jgi:hypothetical protein
VPAAAAGASPGSAGSERSLNVFALMGLPSSAPTSASSASSSLASSAATAAVASSAAAAAAAAPMLSPSEVVSEETIYDNSYVFIYILNTMNPSKQQRV